VLNYDNPTFYDSILDGYTKVNSVYNEYIMYAHNGTMTVEEAMAEAKEIADEAIIEERGY